VSRTIEGTISPNENGHYLAWASATITTLSGRGGGAATLIVPLQIFGGDQ
jgi:hypothetical protein